MSLAQWTRKHPTGMVTTSTYLDHTAADAWWRQQRTRLAQRTALFNTPQENAA